MVLLLIGVMVLRVVGGAVKGQLGFGALVQRVEATGFVEGVLLLGWERGVLC